MSLGENIYRLRTMKNMSQGDLADALDISRQSVSKWENDSAVPELDKLIKMSNIFGVTLDELVGNTSTIEPQPFCSPMQAAPAQGMATRKIVGIVLLCFGLLTFLVFGALSFLDETDVDFGFSLLFSAPFVLCGTICLLCKHHTGLCCAWAIYLPLWAICLIFMEGPAGFDDFYGVFRLAVLAAGIGIIAFTLLRIYTGKITLPLWGKILLTAAMALLLATTILAMLPLPTVNTAPDCNHQVIIPS